MAVGDAELDAVERSDLTSVFESVSLGFPVDDDFLAALLVPTAHLG